MRLTCLVLLGFGFLVLTSCGTREPQSPTGDAKGNDPAIAQHDAGQGAANRAPDKSSAADHQPSHHTKTAEHKQDAHGQHGVAGRKSSHKEGHRAAHKKEQQHAKPHQTEAKKKKKHVPRTREWDWKEDRKIAEANGWIWTGADLKEGFDQAKKNGKPLMVVLRCPP